MAHLLVSSETVVIDQPQQENSGTRSIGKHKRASHDDVGGLTCYEWPDPDSTKRQALASITNQPDRLLANTSKIFGTIAQKKAATSIKCNVSSSSLLQPSIQSSLDELIVPSSISFLSNETVEMKPIGSEMSFSRSNSRMSFSMAMSSSFRSMESPLSFDSPMHVSSPDLFSSQLNRKEFIDIDLMDCNCAATGEYANDIFHYLREAEVRFHPNPRYMKKQPDITEGMRCILVDWLVEVTEEFKLDQHTLYMALSIVDSMSVMRSKLQLVGGTAMYIASKFEEIFPPEIADFAYITDDTYTKAQIVRMEHLILKVLDFNLAGPTIQTFLLRYLKASEAEQLQPLKTNPEVTSSDMTGGKVTEDRQVTSQTITSLAMYLCELALQDADPYLKYYPSVIAASSVCLARHTLGQTAWPSILQHYSGYSVFDIGSCVQDLHRTLALAPHHAQQAIRQKYSSCGYHVISSTKAPETLPC